MHELALAAGIVSLIEEEARRTGFSRVLTLRLAMGAFAHVEETALRFGLEAAARGSPAEGATLELLRLPGRAWCLDCGENVMLPERWAPCPLCGGERLQVTGGDELRVDELEVS
jgi:hydrogenase nickel incorporation protein HypA/HybF